MNRISQYLAGKRILVTGATGFVGQALIEKILWSCPEVEKLYVLIRPRRYANRIQSAQERLERELQQSSVFDRLRAERGESFGQFLQGKLQAVSGDISEGGLGLEQDIRARLQEELDIIINSAAVVSFDAPVDEALELNTLSVKRVVDFARSCRQVLLVHISTAYVSGALRDVADESIYHTAAPETQEPFPPGAFLDPQLDIDHTRALIQEVLVRSRSPEVERELKLTLVRRQKKGKKARVKRRERLEGLRKRWLQTNLSQVGMRWARQRGWNDTYTYTKALGEQVLVRNRGQVPTAIIRPSVIESSLSEPSPGWLDGLRMADPLIAAIGKGRLKSLPLNPEVNLDLVPVDMVVNVVLACIPTLAKEGGVQIYQVATGSTNPISLGELYDLIYRYFRKNPMLDKDGEPIRIRRLKFPHPTTFRLQHRLRTAPLGTAEKTLEKLAIFEATHRLRRKIAANRIAREKLYYYGEIYEPYLNLNCRFLVDRTLALFASLNEEEKRVFPFDVSQLNWRHYIQNVHIPGVKKYILKLEGSGSLEVGETVSWVDGEVSTIWGLVERAAERFGSDTALQVKRSGQWYRLTFREVEQRAKKLAARLWELGYRKGDRIVLYSENQPEWGVAYLAASRIGLVVVPLDAQTWTREVWSVVQFTGAKAVLASQACQAKLCAAGGEGCAPVFNINDWVAQAESWVQMEPPPVEMVADDVASIIFTTGTGVDPRGAVHTHANFLNNLLRVEQYLPIQQGDQLLSVLPLYHALEFTCGFLMALYGGATVTYATSLKPRVILETMRETGTTCMLGVPTLYALIRDDIERRILKVTKSSFKSNLMATSKQLSRSVERTFGKNIGRQLFARVHQEFGGKIRIFVSGGSALGEELYEDYKAMGMPIYEGYGLTETAPVLTVNPLHRSRKGSAGKPLPGVELRLSHPNRDGVGEIIVKTPSLMCGYYRNPEATRQVIKNGWFHTGDLGWVDEDGYLYITGRVKDVIVTGAGKNVYPGDLEAIYQKVEGVREICVFGVRSGLTEEVHAVIHPDLARFRDSPPDEVRKAIQRRIFDLARELPSYHRLQQIHFWPDPLPRNEKGEVCREAVRQLVQLRRPPRPEKERPRRRRSTPRDELLEELSRLSGIPAAEIASASNLYTDLGLDSLMAIELLLFLDEHFGLEIDDERANQIQTVGDLLRELERREVARRPRQAPAYTVRSTLPYRERPWLDRCLMDLSYRVLRGIFSSYFRLRLENPQGLPANGPFILAANHSSHLDAPVVISAVSRIRGLEEAKRIHILGARDYFFNNRWKSWVFSTLLNVVPIEREEASLAGLRKVKAILSSGEPILIFPEGTRSRHGRIQTFKPGLGLIAWELGVPIIPTFIGGTYEAMPVGRSFPRPRQVRVVFGPPVRSEEYVGDGVSRDEIYRRIARDVQEAIEMLAARTRSER